MNLQDLPVTGDRPRLIGGGLDLTNVAEALRIAEAEMHGRHRRQQLYGESDSMLDRYLHIIEILRKRAEREEEAAA